MGEHTEQQAHGASAARPAGDFMLSEDDILRIMQGTLAGVNPGDALGFSDKEVENLYALAYRNYTAGNFEDACKVFQLLCELKTLEARFWTGLAGCLQAMEKHQDAIDAYTMAATAECFASPVPFLHIAMCFVEMNEREKAGTTLDALLAMGDANDPAHAACHDKARRMLQLLHAGAAKEDSHG